MVRCLDSKKTTKKLLDFRPEMSRGHAIPLNLDLWARREDENLYSGFQVLCFKGTFQQFFIRTVLVTLLCQDTVHVCTTVITCMYTCVCVCELCVCVCVSVGRGRTFVDALHRSGNSGCKRNLSAEKEIRTAKFQVPQKPSKRSNICLAEMVLYNELTELRKCTARFPCIGACSDD